MRREWYTFEVESKNGCGRMVQRARRYTEELFEHVDHGLSKFRGSRISTFLPYRKSCLQKTVVGR